MDRSSTSANNCSSSSCGSGGGGGGGCDPLRRLEDEEDDRLLVEDERVGLRFGETPFFGSLVESSAAFVSVNRFRACTGMGLLDFFLEALFRGETCFLGFLDRSDTGLDRSEEGLVSLR